MPNYQDQIDALAERITALEAENAIPGPAPREPQPGDEALFEALRVWRYERAKGDGVEPFQVFGNATLAAISATKPCDRYELQQVKGIGDHKFGLYGGDVLAIVRQHLDGDW